LNAVGHDLDAQALGVVPDSVEIGSLQLHFSQSYSNLIRIDLLKIDVFYYLTSLDRLRLDLELLDLGLPEPGDLW
jgi:hypothetical protein